ncbi:MAG: hypothetical protein JST12_12540 [Armatimonadetes bacterium]|nr:hypothetical protein [Armatimonadota bacterium]MBS1702485.1 hypothetical protein [Armatimonadota bacterium]
MSSGFMTCPTCNRQVIAGVPTCQFCGQDLRGLAPAPGKKSIFIDQDSYDPVHTGGKPNWVVPAYYIVASYFVLSGALAALLTFMNKKEMSDPGMFTYIGFVFDAISVIMGLGLLAKIEIIRGIVNFVCGISLVFGIIDLLGSFGGILAFGMLGVLGLIQNVISICMNAFMIYLIGETD